MSIYDRFAEKYFNEAIKDFARAERAFNSSDYPQAVFYAQQCVEKAVKAMLEAKKRIVYNHGPELVGVFIDVFEREWVEGYGLIVEALEYLSEYYTRSRYPFLLRGEILSPEDIVSREIAERGLELAKKALGVVENYLRGRGIIKS
ncbi:MAG: HEPN domain-containing protein [Candidatus Nezhaarchaeales archaeon]